MAKLPQLTAIQLIKILSKIGFKAIRQEGSHVFLRHDDGQNNSCSESSWRKIRQRIIIENYQEGCSNHKRKF